MKVVMLFLLIAFLGFAQSKNPYGLIDSKMDKIPKEITVSTDEIAKYITTNFKTDNDKIRAVFYWTASNISYDIANINTIDYSENSQDKIKSTLLSKKGVCIHYAEVFNDLAQKTGIESYIVYGYTKQNGKVDEQSHAWCVARIDTIWWFFDPTWGAGYIDKLKYFKKINNLHFKATSSQFITTHMPFDYLWQFLNYPITNQEFVEGKLQVKKSKPKFDFVSQFEAYKEMNELEKAKSSLTRIQSNGVINQLIQDRITYNKVKIEAIQNNDAMERFNTITVQYNHAIELFNAFIYYRNNKFKPILADDEIKSMINNPKKLLMDCQNRIYSIGKYNENNSASVKSLKMSIIEVLKQIEEHEQFVNSYLSKNKAGRKSMFSRVTFYGVPVN